MSKIIQKKPRVLLRSKKSDQAHLIIGYRGDPMGAKGRYAEGLLATILGGNMSSRMFLEVRERRGLAYAIRTSADHQLDTGSFATYAGVQVKGIDEALRVILKQYQAISDSSLPITSKELLKAKEFVKGQLALTLEDTKAVNGFFALEELMLGKTITPDQVFNKIDQVKIEDVVAVAKDFFKTEKLNLAIIGPYKSQARFEKLIS